MIARMRIATMISFSLACGIGLHAASSVAATGSPGIGAPVLTATGPFAGNLVGRGLPLATRAPLFGINVSGGEFHGGEGGSLMPAPAELDAYHAAGFNLFRIPFRAGQLNSSLPKLVALAEKCISLRVPCIFDRHEFSWPAVTDQIAFAAKFDRLMPKGDYVQIDLMNEPNLKLWDQWAVDSQAIVTGVRASGVKRWLWLEYPGSSATFRFDKGKRPPAACDSAACSLTKLPGGTVVDPLHKTGLEGHRYFDAHSSGTTSVCATSVSVADFARKALPFGMPVMLGEFAFGNGKAISATCAALAPKILAEITASPNLYGVTAYGGGKAWNRSYLFYTPPDPKSTYVRMITGVAHESLSRPGR